MSATPPPRDPHQDPVSTPLTARRSTFLRSTFYLLSAMLLVWAAFAIPLPLVEYVPGRPTSIAPLVEIDGVETTEINGDTSLLTVLLRHQPTVPALRALLDPQRSIIPAPQVYVLGQDREAHLELERDRFNRQFEVAAVVGARAAGIEAQMHTTAIVVHVAPDSPADGHLHPGDAVLEVNGAPIIAGEELQALTAAASAGDVLDMTVRGVDDTTREVEVTLEVYGDDGQVRLGVGVQTAVDEIRLPFDIALDDQTRIGGPSAGMMVAVTVYDLLAPEDLVAGRNVMGTGTIDADGRIGAVGGVPEKVRAAADANADLMLVPISQLPSARAAAPESLEVVGVATLDEALTVLRDHAPAQAADASPAG